MVKEFFYKKRRMYLLCGFSEYELKATPLNKMRKGIQGKRIHTHMSKVIVSEVLNFNSCVKY